MLPKFVEIVDARQGLCDHWPLDRGTDRRLERGRVFKRGRQRGVLWNVAEMCCWLFDSIFACITHCLPMYLFNRIYPIYNQLQYSKYTYIVVYSISAQKFLDLSFYSYSVPLLVPPRLAADRLKGPHFCFLFEKRPGVAKVRPPFYFHHPVLTLDHGHRKALATETFLSH